jgi:NSS family neurotransmitter:Na+ symporter
MSEQYTPVHGVWASRWVFILAATGSAVGLGNIWKFPYITGEYGGGAFVLVYLFCIAIVGIPIMIAEVALGRRGGLSPIHSMAKLAEKSNVTRKWAALGFLGAASGFLLLSFYSVIAGWALYYVWQMGSGLFTGATAETVEATFNGLLASPWVLIGCHTLFMVMTLSVVAHGVERGLERAVRVLMPALFVLLLILLGYGINSGGFQEGAAFMFAFDFSKLTGEAILVALGHSFFTLSLGLGAIMAYGAYMPREIALKGGGTKPVSIGSTVLTIAALDTIVALVAGMAIFPVVFANGLEPGTGPGLMFVTLPLAFGQMPGGVIFGTLFFLLVACAAWSSSISLGEPLVAWAVEKGASRRKAAAAIGVSAWVIGLGTVFSFNIWADATLGGKTFFDILDFTVSNIMLPLGGLLIAIFGGWIMKETQMRKELAMKSFGVYMVWRAMVRIFAPAAVLAIFINTIWQAL